MKSRTSLMNDFENYRLAAKDLGYSIPDPLLKRRFAKLLLRRIRKGIPDSDHGNASSILAGMKVRREPYVNRRHKNEV